MFYSSVYEKTTPCFQGTLVDEDGVAISSSDVNSVKLTLYLKTPARTVINSRSSVEVLNGAVGSTDEFTISIAGEFEFVFTALDTAMVSSTLDEETHKFDFAVSYTDSQARSREMAVIGEMVVINRRKLA